MTGQHVPLLVRRHAGISPSSPGPDRPRPAGAGRGGRGTRSGHTPMNRHAPEPRVRPTEANNRRRAPRAITPWGFSSRAVPFVFRRRALEAPGLRAQQGRVVARLWPAARVVTSLPSARLLDLGTPHRRRSHPEMLERRPPRGWTTGGCGTSETPFRPPSRLQNLPPRERPRCSPYTHDVAPRLPEAVAAGT